MVDIDEYVDWFWFNRTFMELKLRNAALYNGSCVGLIVPLWN